MKLIVFAVSFILIGSSAGQEKKCGPERAVQADNCASKLFVVGDRRLRMPQSISEMEIYCSTIRKAGRCLKIYANECLQPLPKQLSSVLNRAVEQNSIKICNTPQGRNQFINQIGCVNKNINTLHQCMDKYIDSLERIKNVESRNKVPLTCCHSSFFRICMEKGIEGLCPPESDKYIHELVISYAREVLETLCGQWTGPGAKERCKVLPPLPARESRSSRSVNKTPYNPIMNIFTNL